MNDYTRQIITFDVTDESRQQLDGVALQYCWSSDQYHGPDQFKTETAEVPECRSNELGLAQVHIYKSRCKFDDFFNSFDLKFDDVSGGTARVIATINGKQSELKLPLRIGTVAKADGVIISIADIEMPSYVTFNTYLLHTRELHRKQQEQQQEQSTTVQEPQ